MRGANAVKRAARKKTPGKIREKPYEAGAGYDRSMNCLYAKRMTRLQKVSIAALITGVIYGLGSIPAVAEYVFARGLTRACGCILNFITMWLPFSLYEIAAIALSIGGFGLLLAIIVWICRRNRKGLRTCLYRLTMAALCVLTAFGVLYAPLYERQSVYAALGLSDAKVTQEQVVAAAEYYVEQLNALAPRMERDGAGNIRAELSFSQTSRILNEELGKYGDYFNFYGVRAKPVALSVPMSYLGITGIYFPFFAEASVNTNIPPYTLPVTMAHEMAHAKGVSRENEANVTAYAVCIRSEHPYLRYSGLMSATATLLNALPQEEYERLYADLDEQVRQEYRNAGEHYKRYEGLIDRISSFFNDLFLKANGVQAGTGSYGQTTGSLVALYQSLTAEENGAAS